MINEAQETQVNIQNLESNIQEISIEKNRQDYFIEPTLRVIMQPQEESFDVPRSKAKNVARLLVHLGIRPYTALVVRDGIPITPDTRLYPNQEILIRKVMSSG